MSWTREQMAARAVMLAARISGRWSDVPMTAPAAAVPAEPAVILRAPTQTKIWPRPSIGEYSLRAAQGGSEEVGVRDAREGVARDGQPEVWGDEDRRECCSDDEREACHEFVGLALEGADHDAS